MRGPYPTIRDATTDDLPTVMNVLDGANLEAQLGEIDTRIGRGMVLVAVWEGAVLGVLVYERTDEGVHVDAVAVRRRWRDQGIGTRLVEEAASRGEMITAAFNRDVRQFYERLGFTIEPTDNGRLWGSR